MGLLWDRDKLTYAVALSLPEPGKANKTNIKINDDLSECSSSLKKIFYLLCCLKGENYSVHVIPISYKS